MGVNKEGLRESVRGMRKRVGRDERGTAALSAQRDEDNTHAAETAEWKGEDSASGKLSDSVVERSVGDLPLSSAVSAFASVRALGC